MAKTDSSDNKGRESDVENCINGLQVELPRIFLQLKFYLQFF